MSAADDLPRAAERVARRLSVVGPRMAARQSPAAAEVLDDVRRVLQQIADLAAAAEGAERRAVPPLAAHALGDQVLVLAHDVAASGDDAAVDQAWLLLADLDRRL